MRELADEVVGAPFIFVRGRVLQRFQNESFFFEVIEPFFGSFFLVLVINEFAGEDCAVSLERDELQELNISVDDIALHSLDRKSVV